MRRYIAVALLVVTAVVLTGCIQPEPPVRVGVLVWPPYELAYLAREKGYIENANVELVDYQTPAEMVRSYRFGLIDAMFVPSIYILANAHNLDTARIIYIINFSDGGDSLLAQPDIDSIAELNGKRIGVEAGPLGAYMLERALRPHGLTRNDVELVFIDTPDQKAAFEAGDVDAVATYEPTRTQLLQQGANELFDSSAIPLEIIDVIIARQSAIDAQRSELAKFVRGMDGALHTFWQAPEASAAIMAKRESITVPDFLNAIDGMYLLSLAENHALLSDDDTHFMKRLELQSKVMLESGIVNERPDIETLVDASVVREARQ